MLSIINFDSVVLRKLGDSVSVIWGVASFQLRIVWNFAPDQKALREMNRIEEVRIIYSYTAKYGNIARFDRGQS